MNSILEQLKAKTGLNFRVEPLGNAEHTYVLDGWVYLEWSPQALTRISGLEARAGWIVGYMNTQGTEPTAVKVAASDNEATVVRVAMSILMKSAVDAILKSPSRSGS